MLLPYFLFLSFFLFSFFPFSFFFFFLFFFFAAPLKVPPGANLPLCPPSVRHWLDNVSAWVAVNNLSLNVKKSCEMIVRRPRLAINDTIIPPALPGVERVFELNILGVRMSYRMDFIPHINYVTTSAVQSTYERSSRISVRTPRVHRLHWGSGGAHRRAPPGPPHVCRWHAIDGTLDDQRHSKCCYKATELLRSHPGLVQFEKAPAESNKVWADLVRIKDEFQENRRSRSQSLHRARHHQAGQCGSRSWSLLGQRTIHETSYQHRRPCLFLPS